MPFIIGRGVGYDGWRVIPAITPTRRPRASNVGTVDVECRLAILIQKKSVTIFDGVLVNIIKDRYGHYLSTLNLPLKTMISTTRRSRRGRLCTDLYSL